MFVYMIDLHSGMESMIQPTNLCCTNLKNSEASSVKHRSYRERVSSGKCKSDGLSHIQMLQEGSPPASLLLAFNWRMLFRYQFVKKTAIVCMCVEKEKKQIRAFLNAHARACTKIDTPHK